MRELLAVALAFGLMLILLRKNVNFGVTMLITSATLCVVAGIAPLTVFNVIKTTFTSEKNITTPFGCVHRQHPGGAVWPVWHPDQG